MELKAAVTPRFDQGLGRLSGRLLIGLGGLDHRERDAIGLDDLAAASPHIQSGAFDVDLEHGDRLDVAIAHEIVDGNGLDLDIRCALEIRRGGDAAAVRRQPA